MLVLNPDIWFWFLQEPVGAVTASTGQLWVISSSKMSMLCSPHLLIPDGDMPSHMLGSFTPQTHADSASVAAWEYTIG